MNNDVTFPFIPVDSNLGEASLRPSLPLTLIYGEQATETVGLLDTGLV